MGNQRCRLRIHVCGCTVAAARAATGHVPPWTEWCVHGTTGAQCDVNLRGARVASRGS